MQACDGCGHAGGLIQLLAGMWEMWKANTFAATAFSSYGGFWMGWSLYGILKSVRCVFSSPSQTADMHMPHVHRQIMDGDHA